MRVIGTAGHVDHGKSTLIEALTGKHPDRLKEEKTREMTIELGFGWLTLPNGEEVGVVDVPGHRDFIENMLAGVGGIDAVLLVVAADEGVMPQTKEHLAILDLLQISAGLIVLTKTDLAADSDWLNLVEADVRRTVAKTVLAEAPILRVAAKSGNGVPELIRALEILLEDKPARPDLHRPRLPIDRAFAMSGFGAVVTGTLRDGSFSVGDEVEILPRAIRGRIRGLQTHKQKEESAAPGSRTAVNISGADAKDIRRGDTLVRPNQYQTTRRLDVRFSALNDMSKPLKHNDEIKFFVNASETIATVRVLGADEIVAGEAGWLQLELRDPVVALRGDRYILRRPSPGETIGGGAVVESQPQGRHKRFDESVIKTLEALTQGSPADVLLEAASALQIASASEIIAKSRLEINAAQTALDELLQSGQLIALDNSTLMITSARWAALSKKMREQIKIYHAQFPLRRGIPREELKSKVGLSSKAFNAALKYLSASEGARDERGTVSESGHEIKFAGRDQIKVQALRRAFAENPRLTPSVKECTAEAGEEIVNALIESGELILISADIIFRAADYDDMVAQIKNEIQTRGKITLAEARDVLQTSRKYAQALLEYLDRAEITKRDGEARRLGKRKQHETTF
ncbi:MAG: selenocysteine-specific translation elongation factor [Anaerolineales bacterium]|nr:selenocysteine-specific translation elongation factor [Anaerolineales bacterium]